MHIYQCKLSCSKSCKQFQSWVAPSRALSSSRSSNFCEIPCKAKRPFGGPRKPWACAFHAGSNRLAPPRFFTARATPPIRGLQESIRGNYAFTLQCLNIDIWGGRDHLAISERLSRKLRFAMAAYRADAGGVIVRVRSDGNRCIFWREQVLCGGEAGRMCGPLYR